MGILKLILTAVFILSAGCANPTKGMTPEQATAYKEQAKYEALAKRDKRHDDIRSARKGCKDSGGVWFVRGRFSASERMRMNRHEDWLPSHAYLMDFACASHGDAARIIRGL